MPPHIIRRGSKKEGVWYLVDGRAAKSLKTTVKRIAEAKLNQYIRGKFRIDGGLTVREYYDQWIETKKPPLVRKSAARDYRQAFTRYVLPACGDMPLQAVSLDTLRKLRDSMLRSSLSMKTARNVIDGAFRAFWRDARRADLVDANPFELMDWPTIRRPRPDPFTVQEREVILAWFWQNERFYYPYTRFQFETGCRPSESTAIRWNAIEAPYVWILGSRNMGVEDQTKTRASRRQIKVSDELLSILGEIRMPFHGPDDQIFRNKEGGVLDHDEYQRTFWRRCLEALPSVRYRTAYKMRHTAITEAVRRGNLPAHVAQYFGTSIQMIQEDYCGKLELDTAEIRQLTAGSLASPTGFEPTSRYPLILAEVVNSCISSAIA